MEVKRSLLLNSKGLNTKKGTLQIKSELDKLGYKDLSDKTMYVVTYPEYEVDDFILRNCLEILGLKEENIRFSKWNMPDYSFVPDMIHVCEGNTFEVLNYMNKYGITEYIKSIWRDKQRKPIYIGSSAGAMIAGSDIMLAKDFDSNFVGMHDFRALELFIGAIIPHYTQKDLIRYIALSEEHIINRYPVIYSVSNDEVLFMNMEE